MVKSRRNVQHSYPAIIYMQELGFFFFFFFLLFLFLLFFLSQAIFQVKGDQKNQKVLQYFKETSVKYINI